MQENGIKLQQSYKNHKHMFLIAKLRIPIKKKIKKILVHIFVVLIPTYFHCVEYSRGVEHAAFL